MPIVTLARAQQLFALCNGQICCPCSAPSPCIPFLYPDNGCWARAHEMCRLMIADGAQPEKVWIRGQLRVNSSNKPNCLVQWAWHVAPTLQVNINGSPQTYVIDPSLCNEPVPLAAWKGIQGDPNASLTPSGADQYWPSGGTDPNYSQTATDLTTHRNLLKLRSASSDGPPPYTSCMVRPPGTQWFGLIEGNQTQLWFSWGWPAGAHVLWHVMPLTPCPGGAQLTWDVAVERANGSQATYWITVTNRSADRVRFAGRYDTVS